MSAMGTGTLMGLAWGDRANEKDFQAERARLARELEEAKLAAIGQTAQKEASKAVANRVADELRAEQEGRLKVRRLSEPANVSGRNDAFMATAEGNLRRMSDGSLSFDEVRAKRVRMATAELKDVLVDPLAKPRLRRGSSNTLSGRPKPPRG